MNRRDFLQLCARMGLALPAAQFLGCAPEADPGWFDGITPRFDGTVLIVGAGAAGLAAGYLLSRFGIDFTIVEARDRIGGRVKGLRTLADFPIDLGAEWIHDEPNLLSQLLGDDSLDASIDVIPYSPRDMSLYNDGLTPVNFVGNYYGEYKFYRSGWFPFLEEFVAAPILDRIRLNTPVTAVDHSGARVVLTTDSGDVMAADRVLVTVPTAVLAADVIAFNPPLPDAKLAAIADFDIAVGLKVFIEFDRKFYPDLVVRDGTAANRLYYDAAYLKDSDQHVLGLFWVDSGDAELDALVALDDAQILASVIADLDMIFEGAATDAFIQGVVQNWTNKPWSRGAYTWGPDDGMDALWDALQEPIDDRVHFAGETLAAEATATVHGAMESGYTAARAILETE